MSHWVILDLIASVPFGAEGARHAHWLRLVCGLVIVVAGIAIGSLPVLVAGAIVVVGSLIYALYRRRSNGPKSAGTTGE